ncbi:hypothetical protein [Moraxella sp. Pampa]|uniref:hypothetical protein n=1 Tax=Moraxella sp. Pampa TaxID=3111978 RepID=UPI002B415F71|nr:hypothetical protein [Moraxella sp. Pampa]
MKFKLPRPIMAAVVLLAFLTTTVAQAGLLDGIRNISELANSIGNTANSVLYSKQATEQLVNDVGINIQSKTKSTQATLTEGSLLMSKLSTLTLYKNANQDKPIAKLTQTDALVYLGQEQQGFLYVATDKGEGWVRSALVSPHY